MGKLWEIATGDNESGTATIEIISNDVGAVVLHWNDGSKSFLCWDNGEWGFVGEGCTNCPCDVTARDSF